MAQQSANAWPSYDDLATAVIQFAEKETFGNNRSRGDTDYVYANLLGMAARLNSVSVHDAGEPRTTRLSPFIDLAGYAREKEKVEALLADLLKQANERREAALANLLAAAHDAETAEKLLDEWRGLKNQGAVVMSLSSDMQKTLSDCARQSRHG